MEYLISVTQMVDFFSDWSMIGGGTVMDDKHALSPRRTL